MYTMQELDIKNYISNGCFVRRLVVLSFIPFKNIFNFSLWLLMFLTLYTHNREHIYILKRWMALIQVGLIILGKFDAFSVL